MEIKLSDHFNYRKLLRFCFAPIIMMVFTSIYGVVDGLFVSNFVGKIPFAAINLVMPYIMILGGLGFMLGTGGSALVAKTLGEGKAARANKYFGMMVKFTIVLGLITSLISILFMRQISLMLGATPEMLEDCVTYGRVMLSFNTAYMLQSVFQTFMTTAEKPKLGLWMTVIAGVSNMVLDTLFIAVFQWGVTGAALATGISQCIGGILPMIYFIMPNDSLLKLTNGKMMFKPIWKACTNGASELMTSISGSVISIVFNFQLLKFAGEDGIASYGVLMYIQFIFIAIFVGYTIGTAPIVGYHYGAGHHKELKSMLKKSMTLTAATGMGMVILAEVLAAPLSQIFVGYDQGLYDMTVHAFQIYAFSFVLTGLNIFVSSFFTALNNGVVSAIISFSRTLGFQLLFVFMLPMLFGLEGIWWAIAAAEGCALIVSTIFLFAKRNEYHYM